MKQPDPPTYALIWAVPCAVVGESNVPWKVPPAAPVHAPVAPGVKNSPPRIGDGALSALPPEPEQGGPVGGTLMGPE